MADAAPQTQTPNNNAHRQPRNRHRGPRNSANPPREIDGVLIVPDPIQHGNRPRGGRGRRGQNVQPSQGRDLLGAQPEVAMEAGGADSNHTTRGSRRGGRAGRARGERQDGGLPSRQQIATSRTVQGRQFGGKLTVHNETPQTADAGSSIQLHAEAPEFRPGQPALIPKGPKKPQQSPRKRRMSKSTAPDIASRIHEDIDNSQYECAVCTNEVLRNSKIWSCRTCWSVFHLSCVKKWASSEGSSVTQQQNQSGAMPPPRQWRCPGCNLPKDDMPNQFTCWCEKETDPRSLPGLPPFSCGQTCSRSHILPKSCPHKCANTCHAGPCLPCPQIGPTQSCFCARESVTRKCIDTDYENGWSCGQICGEIMPCGEHFCERACHEGLCGACEVRVDARCYCGQVEKDIICCERDDDIVSKLYHQTDSGETVTEEWTGNFECGNICDRAFDCGKHNCEKTCHSQHASIPHCPRSPDIVSHCPCGKTPLAAIASKPRSSCEDPIPACSEPCLKTLNCGHSCQVLCHSGDCPPCMQTTSINCRCGRTTSKTICHQGMEEPPECMRICRANLNCGRHECGEHCCPGEKKAVERMKRKARPLNSAPLLDGFEAEHICTRPCDRLLKCGNHTCEELCHKGPCGSCREAIFEEVSCNCGRTVLQPPLPCGTRPPPCRFQCERARDCGHIQVPHNCHEDVEECPKCPFLTTKPCLCAKNQLKNQPCWLQDVRCGEICGRKLKCGFHRCQKSCHRPGECEDAGKPCQQLCAKEKSCGHPCSDKCHSPFTCKEDKPCAYKIFITCDCQRIKQEAKCGATKNNDGNAAKSLKCDDECARLERNRRLALALNIDSEAHHDDHIPYQAETLNMYLENTKWAQIHEKELRLFAADPDERRLRFKPMKGRERAFLHALAEDFGFDSESMDPEPHRHVAIFKTPRFVMAPMKTLAECARIRQIQRSTTTSTPAPEASKKIKASNVVGDPFNAFLITDARFGLTVEELRKAINPILTSGGGGVQLDISFLPSEQIVLKPLQRVAITERALETTLSVLKTPLAKALSTNSVGKIQLCRIDDSLNILHLESDNANSGWSQVAAKAAAPRRQILQDTRPKSSNGFAVFSTAKGKATTRASTTKRGIEREESIEEDWEAAEAREEEKEKAIGSSDEVELDLNEAAASGSDGGAEAVQVGVVQ
jgi:transcriptional repressor NF-X1